MFLVNSRFPLFSAPHNRTNCCQQRSWVPLLPKLRGHFAEFLNHSSPVRLSILNLTTCVGLGYGPHTHSLEAFLDSTGSPPSPITGYASRLTHIRTAFNTSSCHTLTPQSTKWRGYPTVSPHHVATTTSGPTHKKQQPTHSVDKHHFLRMVSINDSPLVAYMRVPEYQLVIHRLRLSASP